MNNFMYTFYLVKDPCKTVLIITLLFNINKINNTNKTLYVYTHTQTHSFHPSQNCNMQFNPRHFSQTCLRHLSASSLSTITPPPPSVTAMLDVPAWEWQ